MAKAAGDQTLQETLLQQVEELKAEVGVQRHLIEELKESRRLQSSEVSIDDKITNWRRLTRDLVELLILHGFAFVELLSCSCMLALPCWRQDAAVQRTPPMF